MLGLIQPLPSHDITTTLINFSTNRTDFWERKEKNRLKKPGKNGIHYSWRDVDIREEKGEPKKSKKSAARE